MSIVNDIIRNYKNGHLLGKVILIGKSFLDKDFQVETRWSNS